MGRPSIHGTAMSGAERKARSRANALGQVDGQLQVAERLASEWLRCMQAGRPGATDRDIEGAFAELALHISAARLAMPRS